MEPLSKRPRIKNDRILVERIEKFISPIYFSDVNLTSRLYESAHEIEEIWHYAAYGRISYDDATSSEIVYEKVNLNSSFGPTWSTHWFRLNIDLSINKEWKNKEVRLRWNSGSEAMVWISGKPMQGLTGGDGQLRTDYVLTNKCSGSENITLFIEMAANGMFGAGKDGTINPPDPNQTFALSMCQLAVRNYDAYILLNSLENICNMAKALPKDSTIRQKALIAGCDAVNCCQPFQTDSIYRANDVVSSFFGKVGDNLLGHYNIHAIGHCHIDTAWLWTYDETKRKCARSWSSVIALMKKYPDFKFACSQAVQFDWVKESYPQLYKEIQAFAEKGQFIPVGGTWVEMDGNIPSGEAFVRQFLYGQKFFKKEFGKYCDVFWLPDTFGYSAQLPQIILGAGIKYFLTQKISWSLINKFPHNSFTWQGIDGSRCLTHFPPADTYESHVSFEDVLKTEMQNKDKGVVSDGMLLYGYGDGGGGPTETMIENLEQFGNISGLPSIKHSSPLEFFKKLETVSSKLHTWVGELYLELHQGTFTTHAKVKKQNRRCEILLKNLEFLETLNYLYSGCKVTNGHTMCEKLWKKILLNQFHDVLPGSSINQVYVDAHALYDDVVQSANTRINEIVNNLKKKTRDGDHRNELSVVNTCSWSREGVFEIPYREDLYTQASQKSTNGNLLAKLSISPFGGDQLDKVIISEIPNGELSVKKIADEIALENEKLKVMINNKGQLTSLILKDSDIDVIGKDQPVNMFYMYTDICLYWDAWDVMPYNEETRNGDFEFSGVEILEEGPLRASVKFSVKLSAMSELTQVISLDSSADIIRFDTKVCWYENRQMLKVAFPFNIKNTSTTYDIQFGHIDRPSHANTSWDWAKHEVCANKWVDVAEFDLGVALLNDSKYGFSCYGNHLEMSLLRSPKAPDGEADMGEHEFSYALMPHKGSFQESHVIRRANEFNNPPLICQGTLCEKLFDVSVPNVILETVKLAEDGDGIILRLYESYGGRVKFTIYSRYQFKSVTRVNLLEEKINDFFDFDLTRQNIHCFVTPFEIVTFRLTF